MKYSAVAVGMLVAATSLPVFAVSLPDITRQEQLQQAREADAARNERFRRPSVTVEGVTNDVTITSSAVSDGPSFYLGQKYI